MKVIGLRLIDVEMLVREVGKLLFNGNLRVLSGRDRSKGGVPRCTFSLGVWNSSRYRMGTRALDMNTVGAGPHGKAKTFTACWHAHFYVIEAMISSRPPGVVSVQTSKASYGHRDYLDVAYDSAFVSSCGALAYQLCECGDDMWPFDDEVPALVGELNRG